MLGLGLVGLARANRPKKRDTADGASSAGSGAAKGKVDSSDKPVELSRDAFTITGID